ncbi:nudC domain-containing protein 2-like [Watersipora subatra]|uniref:nudC domain-containing protein 2-like n=1 Tax=Watersipora subatra TaxID=2589382 RepID=UPI00355B036B
MADFDERSGIVCCETSWGLWYQTLDEVSIEVRIEEHIKSKDISLVSESGSLSLSVAGTRIISGTLFSNVKACNTLWTLETDKDGKLLRIILQKRDKDSANTWPSLLKGEYVADEWLLKNMRTKAALERMQLENPGFDFSGAEVTGNYATGGPELPA